ncbi:hypothetical protein EIN_433350 [Entamoeba invadens IP1]|uniref:Uncharacterized protein n=1 Tax=Entamoeba invadens IP1 TaxID=370355 RepID=A0A0A1UD00_ENTIV|nr:hypothetical protein EIN_433350 [Entamoeba invadens IP1]ELP93713.1 hypothetical protein EIN_433350 [Entamoeba invadens IP1]|eukprot:XP_004260484.1 hypothetical protein EIN_433350 [Entamoeba invadens IP1]
MVFKIVSLLFVSSLALAYDMYDFEDAPPGYDLRPTRQRLLTRLEEGLKRMFDNCDYIIHRITMNRGVFSDGYVRSVERIIEAVRLMKAEANVAKSRNTDSAMNEMLLNINRILEKESFVRNAKDAIRKGRRVGRRANAIIRDQVHLGRLITSLNLMNGIGKELVDMFEAFNTDRFVLVNRYFAELKSKLRQI